MWMRFKGVAVLTGGHLEQLEPVELGDAVDGGSSGHAARKPASRAPLEVRDVVQLRRQHRQRVWWRHEERVPPDYHVTVACKQFTKQSQLSGLGIPVIRRTSILLIFVYIIHSLIWVASFMPTITDITSKWHLHRPSERNLYGRLRITYTFSH